MNAIAAPQSFSVNFELPEKFAPLFEPKRFKVMYGGRDGAKTWTIGRVLIGLATGKTLRIACCREIQKNIKESVHTLLKTQIEAAGLQHIWEVQETRIFNRFNGSEFIFMGLRSLNVENIKSLEGVDIVWVEEARNVSRKSWDTLVPTIRKDGSEIWTSFNPELDTDETYVRFILGADDDVCLIPVSWRDNPWRSKVLDNDRTKMERDRPDDYLTVYEGKCRQYLEGAIYAKEIRSAISCDRITRVPVDPTKPVHTFWDLGRSDMTAIFFVQINGFEYHVIDYYENSGEALPHYLMVLDDKNYLKGVDWIPHDGNAHVLATKMSIKEMIVAAGRTCRIVPSLPLVDGVNAARTIFPKCYFDDVKTRDGRNRLARYCYKIDENGQRSRLPLHDENSHAADAFRYFAVASTRVTNSATQRPLNIPKMVVN